MPDQGDPRKLSHSPQVGSVKWTITVVSALLQEFTGSATVSEFLAFQRCCTPTLAIKCYAEEWKRDLVEEEAGAPQTNSCTKWALPCSVPSFRSWWGGWGLLGSADMARTALYELTTLLLTDVPNLLPSSEAAHQSTDLCYFAMVFLAFSKFSNTTATTRTWTCFVCNIQFCEYFNSIPSLYPTLHNTFELMYLFVQRQHLYTALHE